jgi:DNA topoisomerase-1
MRFYKPYIQSKEASLPALVEGQKVSVKKVKLNDNFTKPPTRYNPRSLLLKMEKEEIGTKATRATIIQTLHDRKYLSGTSNLSVSDLGFEVVEVLQNFCPTVVSSEMTRTLEKRMEAIQQGKENKQNVLQDTIENLKGVMSELKEKEAEIGARLSKILQQGRLDERTVGACTKCSDGTLVILRSKKSGKRFVGCTNYFEGKCTTTFPLPQTGTVKPLGTVCKSCGSPIVAVYQRGRYPWKLCINMKCPSKGERTP